MRSDDKLDLRGTIGPWCFLQCKSRLAAMRPGGILEINICDSETLRDLIKILERSGEIILEARNEGDHHRLRVQKGVGLNYQVRKEKTMSNVDLDSIKPAGSVDARGSACPGPLLEAKKGIGKVKVGEVLEVLSNDSGTRNDLPIWAQKVGHEYLGYLSVDGYDRLFIVRKK